MNENETLNTAEKPLLVIPVVSSSFSLSTIQSFLYFEKEQKKTLRGNIEMYDIKGHYKYLTFSELFNWYVSRF